MLSPDDTAVSVFMFVLPSRFLDQCLCDDSSILAHIDSNRPAKSFRGICRHNLAPHETSQAHSATIVTAQRKGDAVFSWRTQLIAWLIENVDELRMLLLSASQSVRKAFHIEPVEITPLVPTADWYRFWRVDARKIRGRGEIMLFTNLETLYTFVADCRPFREGADFAWHFLRRFSEVFASHFGYSSHIQENILVHRAVDRSAAGVMNNFFFMIECASDMKDVADLERWLNDVPIVARKLRPAARLREKLSEKH